MYRLCCASEEPYLFLQNRLMLKVAVVLKACGLSIRLAAFWMTAWSPILYS